MLDLLPARLASFVYNIEKGEGSDSQAASDLTWKNGNVKNFITFNQLSQERLSLIVGCTRRGLLLKGWHRFNNSIHAFFVLQLIVEQRKSLDKLAMGHGTEAQPVDNLTSHEVIRWHTADTRHVPLTY